MEAMRAAVDDGIGSKDSQAAATNLSKLKRLAKRVLTATIVPILRRLPIERVDSTLRRRLERTEELLLLRRFREHLRRLIVERGIQLIHAHSPFRTALPAIRAARDYGLPVVYEVRGLWEESAVASGRFEPGDPAYSHWRRRETDAMLEADVVVCICEELRAEVIRRGVPADRAFVIPNAVEPAALAATAVAPELHVLESLEALRGRLRGTTIGYVGSVRRLEGVEELVRGVAEVLRRGYDVSLLVVGGGDLDELLRVAEELGIEERCEFTGPVASENVGLFYGLIDIFAITRPDSPVTRMVTPLKPLEAMALGKALVISDLPALREIATEDTALLYPPGDVEALAGHCIRLIQDDDLRRTISTNAQRWVLRNRTWEKVLAKLPEVYAKAQTVAAARAHHRTHGGQA